MKLEQRYTAAQVAGLAMLSASVACLVITVFLLPWEHWIGESRFAGLLTWGGVAWLPLGVAAVLMMYRALALTVASCAMGFFVFEFLSKWPTRHSIAVTLGYSG